jgi:hypothetical protein
MAKPSVLVLVPIKPGTHPYFDRQTRRRVESLPGFNPGLEIRWLFDERPMEPEPGDDRCWTRVARGRNRIINEGYHHGFDYALWIDCDVLDFAANLPTRLVEDLIPSHRLEEWAPGVASGIAAPLILIEGSRVNYDYSSFVEFGKSHIQPDNPGFVAGRNLGGTPPYWSSDPGPDPLVPMDGVGACMLVSTNIYALGARYWPTSRTFPDQFPICQKARELAFPVLCDRRLVAYHAYLPRFGIEFQQAVI